MTSLTPITVEMIKKLTKKKHFVLCFLLFSICHAATLGAKEHAVNVLLITDPHSKIQSVFVDELKNILSLNDSSILLKILDINHPDFNEKIISKEIDFAIATGLKPVSLAMKQKLNFPVLYTLIPQLSYNSLIKENETNNPQHFVIFLDQAVERKFALIKAVMGKKSSIGILSAKDSFQEAQSIRILAQALNIELIEEVVKNPKHLVEHIRLISKKVDVIQAIYDREILNNHNAKWLLYISYKMRKPVFAFSENFTKAGALASIFSTSKQIAQQSIEWLNNIKNHQSIEKKQYPNDFEVSINEKVQREFRLKAKTTEEIKQMIKLIESKGYIDD